MRVTTPLLAAAAVSSASAFTSPLFTTPRGERHPTTTSRPPPLRRLRSPATTAASSRASKRCNLRSLGCHLTQRPPRSPHAALAPRARATAPAVGKDAPVIISDFRGPTTDLPVELDPVSGRVFNS